MKKYAPGKRYAQLHIPQNTNKHKEERAVSQTGNRISTVSEARCSGEAAAERRRASGDTGDTERRIREGRRRGEVSVRERAWRRSSDAMGGGGGGAEVRVAARSVLQRYVLCRG
jgi:hypothetical protein